MRKILFFLFIILIHSFGRAQYLENFNDGDFTNNPSWTGDAGLFKVNTAFQLQSNGSADGTASLSVPVAAFPEMEWSCWVKLGFSPSDNNMARIYLLSDQQDLEGSLNGYFIKLGEAGSNDAIELIRQSGTTQTVVCRGIEAFVAAAFAIKVKVIRLSGGNWSIYVDQTGGNNYTFQASGTDNTYTTGSYSGVSFKYTSSNATKFYFDDFYSGPYVADVTPPHIMGVPVDGARQLRVVFSEVVDASAANTTANYSLTPGNIHPISATVDPADASAVILVFAQDFISDLEYTLTISNIADLSANVMPETPFLFSWHRAKTYDILINEIMADPTPPVNMPEAEYVELYNRSTSEVNMEGWTLMLGSSKKIFPAFTLPAGGYVILCNTSSKPLFEPYGTVVDFSSFSVTNGSGTVTLKDYEGYVIHSVTYSLGWFQGSDKKDGGWSLEQVDASNPCGESVNWMACTNTDGGTPGTINSVNAVNPDLFAPEIKQVVVVDTTHIQVWFTESCDSSNLLKLSNYTIDGEIGEPVFVSTQSPDYNMVTLTLAKRMKINTNYTLTCSGNITDCSGNLLAAGTSTQFIIYVDVTPPDVLSVTAETGNGLAVFFSEAVDALSGTNSANYLVSPFSATLLSATKDASIPSVVHLLFSQDFTSDQAYKLNVKNIADLSGNVMAETQVNFSWHRAKTYEVVINEIMADPTPPVILPEAEYVEIYNRSTFPLDLKGWVLMLGSSKKIFPQVTLEANSYAILCSTGSKALFAPYGQVIDFSSFSVTNGSGTITLMDNYGQVIHSVVYLDSFFQGSDKKDGGWSLEQIDPWNPCGESFNWAASQNENGGSPGTLNSVNAPNADLISPGIFNVEVIDTTHIAVYFTESCDSATLLKLSNYSIDKGIGSPVFASTKSPSYRMVYLTLASRLAINTIYTITSTGNISDCAGNSVAIGSKFQFTRYVDVTPPNIVAVPVETASQLAVTFNEAVDAVSATLLSNYVVSPGSVSPVLATKDPTNPAIIHLSFSQPFTPDFVYSLAITDIADISGNIMASAQSPFSWHRAKSFDILINEIMADPTPPVGLPEAEYVELYNRSTYPLYLQNWVLMLGNTPKVLPEYTLPAGGYLILCDDGAKALLAPYGPVVDFSSFSVTNGSSTLTLKDNYGEVIHSVSYTPDWFRDGFKKDGGWSIELIDPSNPCGDAANWTACSNESGGTPGIVNSVNALNPDGISPAISRVGLNDATHLTVWFTETCDSVTMQLPSNFTIDNGIGNPIAVSTLSPDFKVAHLTLASPLTTGIVYTLTSTNNIKDCAGNALVAGSKARFAIPLSIDSNDIVINELLFDPPSGCVDFVEIYNRSSKVLDLMDIALTNYDTINHMVVDFNEISKEPFIILPGEYYILSTDSSSVHQFYKSQNPQAFINMDGFPTMNNDVGVVALTKRNGSIVDLVAFSSDFQYPLLTSVDGVSLERINPERSSRDVTNWHSAAESVGYATPGYKNSQFSLVVSDGNELTLSPAVFSPDNDGYNDNLTIAYSFAAPGNNASIAIYDVSGRLIRNLVNHELCGTSGAFGWDGMSNDKTKALIGRYIVYVEIFDLQGNVKRYKKPVVLGGKL